MDGTILGQGSFIAPSTIVNQVIQIPSGADWVKVKNYTQYGANGAATGVDFYWQRGMAAGTGIVLYKNSSAVLNGDTLASGGFTLYDPSGQTAGALPLLSNPVAFTGVSNDKQPIVSTTNTTGVVVGSIVRLSGTTTPQLDVYGQDWVVTAVSAGSSFTLLSANSALATAPGLPGGAGFYRIVNYNALFYPRRRIVTNIAQTVNMVTAPAGQAIVTTNVPHGFTPGQEVRFTIPQASGMTNLNAWAAGVNNVVAVTIASISATDLNVFNINLDISSFPAFTYPTSAQMTNNSLPVVDPVGEDTGFALTSPTIQVPGVASATLGSQIYNTNTGILADSTVNTGFLGMILGTGGNGTILGSAITGPAGSVAADVVYWVAGKSTYGGL
jgi:hypothetical protein